MAVGVPETEVFAAADRVLSRGERPTVERVRAELGRGSPARIGQLLETWWDALTKRLAGEMRLPDLPPVVAEAFKAVWITATEHGTTLAQAAIADTAAQLSHDQSQLADERVHWEAVVEAAHAAERDARQSAAALEARLLDRQTLLDQQAASVAEAQTQRTALQARMVPLESALETSRQALAAQTEQARQERADLHQHVRAIEDRAHADIDQTRQEAKVLRQRVQALERAADEATKHHAHELTQVRAALAAAQQDAAAQRARADALATQLQALGDLPAALQATLAQVRRPAKRPVTARKRASRAAKS